MGKKAKVIWDNVDELLKSGKRPVIKLERSAEIPKEVKPAHRPRLRPEGAPVGSVKHWPVCSPGGYRMRCRTPGCDKLLRKGRIVCSERCEADLRDWCTLMLGILDGTTPLGDIPPHGRGARLVRQKKRTM